MQHRDACTGQSEVHRSQWGLLLLSFLNREVKLQESETSLNVFTPDFCAYNQIQFKKKGEGPLLALIMLACVLDFLL